MRQSAQDLTTWGACRLVGSSAGAAARRLVLGLFPRFPSSCPFRICRGSVSSARHIARSVRISRTTRSCTFHDKAYATHLHPNLPPPFDGSLLQIMPWPTFQNMTDHDLR